MIRRFASVALATLALSIAGRAQPTAANPAQPAPTLKLGNIRMRDVCILPDQATKTYYMIGPGGCPKLSASD